MRRLLSILLLVCFGFTAAAPMLALRAESEAGLPACCRDHGRHMCMRKMAAMGEQLQDGRARFTAPPGRCPCCPAAPTAPQLAPAMAALSRSAAIHAPPVVRAPQSLTPAFSRTAQLRLRPQRGPPALPC